MLSVRLALFVWQISRPDISVVSSETFVAGTDPRTDRIIRSTSEAEMIDPKGRFEESGGLSEDECCQEMVWVICRHLANGLTQRSLLFAF